MDILILHHHCDEDAAALDRLSFRNWCLAYDVDVNNYHVDLLPRFVEDKLTSQDLDEPTISAYTGFPFGLEDLTNTLEYWTSLHEIDAYKLDTEQRGYYITPILDTL